MIESGESLVEEITETPMVIETPKKQEVLKPEFLYHASTNRSISQFEPRAESIRDANEGAVVFATPSKEFASMFIVNTDDRWTKKSRFNGVYVTIISDKDRFLASDKGGSIYTMSSDTFTTDEGKGMGATEWVSKQPVKPTKKEDYESGLQAMLELGVQVYFVDESTFTQIKTAPDHGFKIICDLKSENEKKGINPKKLG